MRRDEGSFLGWLLASAGIATTLVGGFLPWLRSGRAWRNSYELVRTADRLGLVGGGLQGTLAVSWYLLPLLCGLTLLAIVLDRRWLSRLGVALVVVMVAILVVVTVRAPLPGGSGVVVSGLGAALALAGSIWAGTATRRHVRLPPFEQSPPPVTRTGGRRRRSPR